MRHPDTCAKRLSWGYIPARYSGKIIWDPYAEGYR